MRFILCSINFILMHTKSHYVYLLLLFYVVGLKLRFRSTSSISLFLVWIDGHGLGLGLVHSGLGLGLGLASAGLGLGIGLESYGLGLGLGLATAGLDYISAQKHAFRSRKRYYFHYFKDIRQGTLRARVLVVINWIILLSQISYIV